MTRSNHPRRQSQKNGLRARDAAEIVVFGLGGLALGAALMYVFDPDVGSRRRTRIRDRAGSAVEDAGSRISSTLSSAATGVGGYISDLSQRVGSGVGDQAQSKFQSARDAIGEYATDLSDRARAAVRSRLGAQTNATTGVSVLGALALGCCAMFFLDPRQGRGRRAYVVQKATHLVNKSARLAGATGRHWMNRSRGLYHEAGEMMHSSTPSAEKPIPTAM